MEEQMIRYGIAKQKKEIKQMYHPIVYLAIMFQFTVFQ